MNHPHASLLKLDPVLEEIFTVFGPSAILIPQRDGKLLISEQEIDKLTAETASSVRHLNSLLANGVAVVSGPANQKLAALVLRDVELLQPALQRCPLLKQTLCTDTAAGVCFWFRIQGWTAPSFKGDDLRWISDGGVIPLRRHPPEESGWSVIQAMPILEIRSIELNLTFHASLADHFLLAEVTHRHGGAFRHEQNSPKTLNPAFWAAYCSLDQLIKFDASTRRFRRFSPELKAWRAIPEEVLAKDLSDFIFARTALQGDGYRASLAELADVLGHLRIIAASEGEPMVDTLMQFVSDCLHKRAKATVTSDELFAAFEEYCDTHQLPSVSQQNFYINIGIVLQDALAVFPSHSVRRGHKHLRGYRNVAFSRPELLPAGTAGTDGTGGLDVSLQPSAEKQLVPRLE
jgi:hypothetical protein